MRATAFVQPPRRSFPTWVRYASYVPLFGIGVPLVRLLEAAGQWPGASGNAMRRGIGDFRDYKPTASDVIVCSGFKSGTTWMLQMALQIAFRGEADFDNLHSAVAWPDAPGLLRQRVVPLADHSPRQCSPTGLRIIKTHHLPSRVPYTPAARYIALVRDPKDVIVSGYHFLRSMAYGPLMPSVEHWVEAYLAGLNPTGSWAEHAAGWWRMREQPNVLFMTYERMRRDPNAAIAQVAEFIGVALTDGEFAAVAHKASFAFMKQFQEKFEPGRVVPWGTEGYMLRRGRTGGSGELLSPEIQARIDTRCRAELKDLGSDFPFDVEFGHGVGSEVAPAGSAEGPCAS